MTIQFTQYPAVNNDSADKTLCGDIIRHCKDWQHFADKSSKYTTSHECTHGINNDLRNASGDWQGKNGFYVGKGRAVVLDEPKFKKSDIIPFIPQDLRSVRFNLYVQGQQSWDDKPLYIYDEGVAYINGAWAAIELKEQENYVEGVRSPPWFVRPNFFIRSYRNYFSPYWPLDKSGNAIVDGHIEFIAYMTAVLMCADKVGHEIFREEMSGEVHTYVNRGLDPKLADFSRWLFRHACNAYHRQLKIGLASYDVQDQLWATMKTGAAFEPHRQFLQSKIGFEFADAEVPEDDVVPIPWTI